MIRMASLQLMMKHEVSGKTGRGIASFDWDCEQKNDADVFRPMVTGDHVVRHNITNQPFVDTGSLRDRKTDGLWPPRI